jgi:undecaprenyl pyrophosphate phosphatase UppP
MLKMFGHSTEGGLLGLLVYGAVFAAVYIFYADEIRQMLRENRLARIPRRKRKRQPVMQRVLDYRLMKMAFYVIAAGFFVYPSLQNWRLDLSKVAIFFVINGLMQYIPMFIPTGNKDSRNMTRMDGLWMGLFGATGIVPGISRTGARSSVATIRGADPGHAVNWATMLTMPAMVIFMFIDIYTMFSLGIGSLGIAVLLRYILAAAAAYAGTYIAIRMVRVFASTTGFSGFAYYSWGAALFSLILYLSIS